MEAEKPQEAVARRQEATELNRVGCSYWSLGTDESQGSWGGNLVLKPCPGSHTKSRADLCPTPYSSTAREEAIIAVPGNSPWRHFVTEDLSPPLPGQPLPRLSQEKSVSPA